MKLQTGLTCALAALALCTACRTESPIQRAHRVCLEQEKAKVSKDSMLSKLNDAASAALCSSGPALCEVEPDGKGCTDFIAKYR
jgi:hypothetical protein